MEPVKERALRAVEPAAVKAWRQGDPCPVGGTASRPSVAGAQWVMGSVAGNEAWERKSWGQLRYLNGRVSEEVFKW